MLWIWFDVMVNYDLATLLKNKKIFAFWANGFTIKLSIVLKSETFRFERISAIFWVCHIWYLLGLRQLGEDCRKNLFRHDNTAKNDKFRQKTCHFFLTFRFMQYGTIFYIPWFFYMSFWFSMVLQYDCKWLSVFKRFYNSCNDASSIDESKPC